MKKILFVFLMLKLLVYGDILNESERIYLKNEKRQELERIKKEFDSKEEVNKNIKLSQDKDNNENMFYIEKITLIDNEMLLNDLEKENVLKKYSNQKLGKTKITNLLIELTNKLISKGYITSSVTIADNNDLKSKELILEVIPGRIEKIVLNDNSNLDRLKLFLLLKPVENEVLNVRDLDTTTENFNYLESNDIKFEIKPGTKENYSIIEAKNKKKEKVIISLLTNNYGEDKQNSLWRYGGSVNVDSPLGIEDKLYFSYMTVDKKKPDRSWKDSPDVLQPGEILPIGPPGYDPSKGDTLPYKRILDLYNFRYTLKFTDYSLITSIYKTNKESSFYTGNTVYDLHSINKTYEIKLEKNLWRNQKSKINLAIGIKRRHDRNYLETATLSDRVISVGLVNLYGSTIVYNGVLNTTFGYERGMRVLGAERDGGKLETTPKAQFNKFIFNVYYYRPFKENFIYRFNLMSSYSKDVLYGSEEQSIGGVGSIGGFHRTGTIQGEKAIEIGNEISYKLLDSEKYGRLEPYINYGYGFVKNNKDSSKYSKGHISGTNIGVRYNYKYFEFDAAYGIPFNYSNYLNPKKMEFYVSSGIKIKF
ncbi:Hemolysin transporter protein ShlB [Fusobacterium sp. DD29]|nr:Hemolysin transporter protein ShlB [Fusobacterium sp. DD29]MBR8762420.1 Hemolysin transporter protein ShlB [Fusobacterium sp. DD25]MBR8768442.1 Hemolysin transporter protein ShlB [Fusobacterium sp. DD43]MBR8772510.1 Hemolysin transporter protein ShlB [Fusobacterium sp. DD40]MBR8776732.1 Hemolysin transporter protein ShlB [Fusobacterium sp. DD17]MBR8798992.1 Hemolysin transporter protein ShlB [Fusobacterium sp. DD12]MBR8801161.1 Hemolysin transporter protein ShlB [Fusobacterium sp. DD10]MB